MEDCGGAEILRELRGRLRFELDAVKGAKGAKNLAFVSQLVEIPDDVVFTVEYSVRAAQMAVYRLLEIERIVPPVTPHDRSLRTMLEAGIKSFQ